MSYFLSPNHTLTLNLILLSPIKTFCIF